MLRSVKNPTASNKPVYLTTKRPEIGIAQNTHNLAYLQAVVVLDAAEQRRFRGFLRQSRFGQSVTKLYVALRSAPFIHSGRVLALGRNLVANDQEFG